MSAETIAGIEAAIRAHIADEHGDIAAMTDWFVAVGAMIPSDDSPTGISYVTSYSTSDASPQGALGVAHLGIRYLTDDLRGAHS